VRQQDSGPTPCQSAPATYLQLLDTSSFSYHLFTHTRLTLMLVARA